MSINFVKIAVGLTALSVLGGCAYSAPSYAYGPVPCPPAAATQTAAGTAANTGNGATPALKQAPAGQTATGTCYGAVANPTGTGYPVVDGAYGWAGSYPVAYAPYDDGVGVDAYDDSLFYDGLYGDALFGGGFYGFGRYGHGFYGHGFHGGGSQGGFHGGGGFGFHGGGFGGAHGR